ncbi:MAG: LytTR family DNA-binding domain-containing protein, partial [Bacteroidota bacterium]
LSIGVFPVAIMTLLDYIYKLQKNQAVGDSISSNQLAASPHNKPRNDNARILTLTSDNGKDQFELPASQLLYLQAADNYVEIHYKTEEQTAKYILRNSLQKLADQLPSNSIRRCHRSYLVNLQYVERISGNAQGYKLHLLADSIAIPVSRSKSKDILLYFEEQS